MLCSKRLLNDTYEPTTGMDPCSRQTVWNLLKNRKANSVTVFSTHFMDEADIVADRKAVISRGMLKCLGSSLFLKTKWGIGYRLSMQIDRYCNTEGTAFLIRQHIPGASLLKETEEQLVYALPYKDTDRFSALFADLDTHCHLGVISYGLSISTLEDVFFKLEVEAETDQQDFGVFNLEQAEDKMHRNSVNELEQSLLMLSKTKSCAISNKSLWRKQALVIAKVHFHSFNRDIKSMSEVLALFLVFLCVEIFMFHVYKEYLKNTMAPIKLSPDLYFLKPNETHHKYKTSLLIQNCTNLLMITSQNILTEMFNGSDYVSVSPHNAALNVVHVSKTYVLKAAFNRTMLHSLPLMMNIISNLYLHNLNVTENIHVWISSFIQEITDRSFIMAMIVQCLTVGVTMTGLPSYFTMENAENHRIKAYTQLKLSGLYPSAYWCGQALVDIPLYYTILLVMTGILFGVYHEIIFSPMKIFAVAFCITGYVPSVILFHYVVSFTFKSIQSTKEFWSFIFPTVTLICIIVTDVAFIKWYTAAIIIHMSFCIFVPIYPLIGCLITLLEPYLQCIIWLFLLRHLEVKHGGKSMRADTFFRQVFSCKFLDVSHEDDGDEDVMAEKLKVKEMITCQDCEEKPAVLVISLHKEYDRKTDFLLGRKMKKVATNYLSLCVKKGEVLGILGPNGAGKTTLINILAGEIEPTSGQVLMGDYCLGENIMDNSIKYMGYCPQTNPLWPNVTLQEHFEIYGAIKGMSPSDRIEIIKCFSKALDLKEHLQKRVKKIGAGVKRKLCFALSMLGNPHITLLDEPSTGMDPIAIQHMWKAIRAAFKSKERAAILATHYMAEAEAICDRVAVLVSGKLRYIGTVQHLKTKFGRGYFLEMKLKETPETQQKEYLQRKILSIFPNANCLKSFASILAYKIPKEDVQSLALVFSKLEEAKHAFNIEEYSFSQATLDQVFVELVKEQEEEDSNFATLNGTISWERSQEDRVIF
uniref:ABC transporter domain-containing protein n=1 Tax=Laticauda laticaudata TaxID=8630 RepID=A0A8C5SLX9_LATLA